MPPPLSPERGTAPKSKDYFGGYPARTWTMGEMTMIINSYGSRAQTKAWFPFLLTPPNLLPMLPLPNPGWEPGKASPRTETSNGIAGKGKSNEPPRKAKRELQE